jgi:hypothetical protein
MAQQIVADAHAQSRQMINQSEDFIDGKLGSFEIVLERLLKTTHSGRERLSAQGLPTSLIDDPVEESPAAAPEYRDPGGVEDTASFFDQDAF